MTKRMLLALVAVGALNSVAQARDLYVSPYDRERAHIDRDYARDQLDAGMDMRRRALDHQQDIAEQAIDREEDADDDED
jgi:hypothetical protein